MNLEKEHKSPMEVLAAFIVDKRNLIFFFYICAMIFSVFSQGWVHVENDITAYLPEDKLLHQLPAAGAERFPQIIAGMLGYVRGNAKHLSGSLRQLVCFINDQSANVRQDGAVTAATMNGVCQ